MASGYRGVNVRIQIQGTTIGVVTSAEMSPSKEGGLEHVYGSDTPIHIVGGDRARFRAQRIFFNADDDTDLFFDLFNGETHFNMQFDLTSGGNVVSNTTIILSDCVGYNWNPVLGGPNEVVGEELSGEATSWSSTLS